MENKEVILSSIFLILLASLAFNLNDFSVTGFAVMQSSASLKLDPLVLNQASDLTITIMPGKEGASRFVEFYQNNEKVGETVRLCNDLRCMEKVTVVYQIPSHWQGKLEAQIYDYTSEDYLVREFLVE